MNVVAPIDVKVGIEMKVFVSSLIMGFEELRMAAVGAIEDLGHTAITAETFEAMADAPRVACLNGIRSSSLVVLILGERYGSVIPPADLSATHQEYREAKGSKPVLAFVQAGIEPEPRQVQFIKEVEDWEKGHFRGSFAGPEDLRKSIIKAIHQSELAAASSPVDAAAMLTSAKELIVRKQTGFGSGRGPQLKVSVVGGPAQSILRPSDIESASLSKQLMQDILFGEFSLFDPGNGTDCHFDGGALRLIQSNGEFFSIDEQGRMTFGLNVQREGSGFPAIIEEEIFDLITRTLSFSATQLDKIDETQKLGRVVVAAIVSGAEYVPWRTRIEHEKSPNSISYRAGFTGEQPSAVHQTPPDFPRASLGFNASTIAEDLVTLLKRQAAR